MLKVPRVLVYDHTDTFVCDITPAQLIDITYVEEINGEHSVTVETTQELEKTNRLLIRDGMDLWHEYVVLGLVGTHGGEPTSYEYYCVWSLQYDMSATFVDDQYGCGIVPGHASVPKSASHALGVALQGTNRWARGTVTVTTETAASFYRRSGWKALQTIIEKWGGELQATITVGTSGVTSRKVDLLAHVGTTTPTRRFDYGHDVTGIRRIVSEDVWPCRIVPLGKSMETEAGGYTRRPDIKSVNNNVMWIQDDDVVAYTRVPDGNGGWEYPTAIVENDTYEEPSDLKAWAIAHIQDYTRPRVTYEADVAQFVSAGLNAHGVACGDDVYVVDRKFNADGLRISARVVRITGSMLDPTTTRLTIGNAKDKLSGQLAELSRRLSLIGDAVDVSSQWQSTAAYLSSLIDRINDEVNTTGGYTYITEGQGIRTYDAAVTDPLVGSEASKVVEVKGGSIRIANSRTSGGNWNWKTVFVSGHVAAELVTAAAIVAGYIGSAGDTYIDLDNHTVQLGQTSGPHVVVNAGSMQVYNGTTSLGYFGYESGVGIVRVGQANQGHAVMSSSGYVDVRNSSTILAHFGYGEGTNETGGVSTAPYYDVGVRNANTTVGNYSVAEGCAATASGYCAHAEGSGATATGAHSHAEGYNSTAGSGANAHAEGYNTTASGNNAHAEGYKTAASSSESHAEGDQTKATGTGSHAEGYKTESTGSYAHAEGYTTKASGNYSHASGNGTIASGGSATAVGKYNKDDSADIFAVGCGSSNTNRHSAFTVGSRYVTMFESGSGYTGVLYVRGDVNVNGTTVHSSDRRLKDHVANLGDDAADFVRRLRPVRFCWKGDEEQHMGFYAQDVAEADEWGTATVKEDKEDVILGFAPLTVDYNALIAPLVAYCQHLERRIEALEKKVSQ